MQNATMQKGENTKKLNGKMENGKTSDFSRNF